MTNNFLEWKWKDVHFLIFLAFRCCYCYNWNPARKQRPPAPLLQLPSAPPGENEESSPSSESEVEGEAKEGEVDEVNLDETASEGNYRP